MYTCAGCNVETVQELKRSPSFSGNEVEAREDKGDRVDKYAYRAIVIG